jgi:exopolysaccharide biosynthesis polyprenyl glycosylphosphotransferase
MLGRTDDASLVGDEPGGAARTEEAPVRAPSARASYRRLYRVVALTDALSVVLALLLAYWVRFGPRVPHAYFVAALCVAPLFMVLVYQAFHLYDAYRYTPAEEFRRIILAVSIGIGGVLGVAFWSKTDFSRLWLGLSWAFAIIAALGSRRLWHKRIGRGRKEGTLAFPTLVVGTNAEACHLVELMQLPSFGFRPLGMVSTEGGEARGDPPPDFPVLGTVAELRDVIREVGAECVFVAASALSEREMGHVAKAVRLEGVEVRITATLPEVLSSRVAVQSLGGVTALSLRPVRLTGTQALVKRVFDVVIATTGIVVLSPIWAVVAIAVKVSSSGSVLYRQVRVGQRGRPFTMLKFRTMRVGADAQVEDLRARHGVDDLMFKLADDPRVTPVGRFMRRWSVDELPQLLNVVGGQMSLVGPRPPLPAEVTRYEEWQFDRLEVPPGISGLWQVSGRSDLSFDDCVRLDLFYVENWSLAYDLYILAKTVPVLLSRRGAY